MAIEVKIAPDLDEIRREGNVFETDFNKMHIEWIIAMDCRDMSDENETTLKKWLQNAIGLSSKMWQVPYLLNKHLPFPSEVYVNGEKVDYPKELRLCLR